MIAFRQTWIPLLRDLGFCIDPAGQFDGHDMWADGRLCFFCGQEQSLQGELGLEVVL